MLLINRDVVHGNLFVELQLSLDVLGGVGDADLDAPGDPSGNDPFQGLRGQKLIRNCRFGLQAMSPWVCPRRAKI